MSGEWGFHTPPEQQDVVDARYKKVSNLAARRPLPNDVQLFHSTRVQRAASGGTESTLHTIRAWRLGSDGQILGHLGELSWDGGSGHVAWMDGHQHVVPHMLAKAAEVSRTTGDAPPMYAAELSGYSYRMLKRHMPEALSQTQRVNGLPVLQDHHFAHFVEAINMVHSATIAASEPSRHGEAHTYAADARAALIKAHRAYSAAWALNRPGLSRLDKYDAHVRAVEKATLGLANHAVRSGLGDTLAVKRLQSVARTLSSGWNPNA